VGVIGEIQEAVKTFGEITVKPLLAVAVATAFLVFSPTSAIVALGMIKFVDGYRSWLGAAFVLSIAYLLAHAVVSSLGGIAEWRAGKKLDTLRLGWLKNLTPDEKARLIPYIRDRKSSVTYELQDGVAGGLVGKKILYRASNMGSMYGFAFNLQPWARDALNANPEFLYAEEA
jgi:hypothetical protein